MKNIFADIPDNVSREMFDMLLESGNVRIERIISNGQVTPAGKWLKEGKNEWVVLLEGGAGIIFKNEGVSRRMDPGDHIYIRAGREHRVEYTAPNSKTIWIAVYFK